MKKFLVHAFCFFFGHNTSWSTNPDTGISTLKCVTCKEIQEVNIK